MIRKNRITVNYFIRAFLPPHKRKPNREKLYNVLLHPMKLIMDNFIVWRDKEVIRANMTFETAKMEWYLNHLFDPELKRIYIETNEMAGLVKGDRTSEPAVYVVKGDRDAEPAEYVVGRVKGEDTALGLAKFGVYIPAALSGEADAIKGAVDNYRYAGKTFVIKTF